MIQVVYVSSATRPMSTEELDALLAQSREKNQRLGITGLLLYKDGNILQVLEGDPKSIEPLLVAIRRDHRHDGLITLYTKPIFQRDFADWSMAFRDLSRNRTGEPGTSDVLDPDFDIRKIGESQASMLVNMFKQRMR